jgi:hypothetical protein
MIIYFQTIVLSTTPATTGWVLPGNPLTASFCQVFQCHIQESIKTTETQDKQQGI